MSELKLVSCPSCQTPNRVPVSKLIDKPVCGRCHELLFQGKPADFSARQFDKFMKVTDTPIVVDFWASWCGPCKTMAPVFQQAAKQLEPYFRFVKVETESEKMLATRYAIRSIPTLIVIKNGKEVARQAGAMDVSTLVNWLKQFM